LKYDNIKNIVIDGLNNNDYGIIFDVDVFNSDETTYEKEYNTDNFGVVRKRVVPTMIPSPYGENIQIPYTNAIDGSLSLEFDLFIGDETSFSQEEEDRFTSVNYINTLNSIQDFKRNLLSIVKNLGDVGIFLGGEDSVGTFSGNSLGFGTLYVRLELLDFYDETIIEFENWKLEKQVNGNLKLTVVDSVYTYTIETPYEIEKEIEILIWFDGSSFHLNNAVSTIVPDLINVSSFTLGDITTGLNAKVYDVRLGDTTLTYDTIANVDLESWSVIFSDFDNLDTITSNGLSSNWTGSCDNCVLWGADGNIVFGFDTLVAVGDYDISKGYPYQRFSLSMPFLYSKDIIFGNQFKYFMNLDPDEDGTFDDADDFQVWAIDRQHTFGTETTNKQGITENKATSIVSESMRDVSKTFIYKPNRNMTKLLKKVMTTDVEQNKKYRITIQAPFFKTYYECLVESGGNGTNLSTLSTFTVQFKERIAFD